MATLDVLTLAEARSAIGATNTDQYDDDLDLVVTAVSTRLDELCGPIVTREVTEYHNGGSCVVAPRALPVGAWTSVTERSGETQTVLTAETFATAGTYLYDGLRGELHRRSARADIAFPAGQQTVELVFDAGRAADTASVPARFKEAAKIIVAHIWRNERGSGNQTFGADGEFVIGSSFSIPRRALELIKGDLLHRGIA